MRTLIRFLKKIKNEDFLESENNKNNPLQLVHLQSVHEMLFKTPIWCASHCSAEKRQFENNTLIMWY